MGWVVAHPKYKSERILIIAFVNFGRKLYEEGVSVVAHEVMMKKISELCD